MINIWDEPEQAPTSLLNCCSCVVDYSTTFYKSKNLFTFFYLTAIIVVLPINIYMITKCIHVDLCSGGTKAVYIVYEETLP